MAPTPSPRPQPSHQAPSKTPIRNRVQFKHATGPHPSPAAAAAVPTEHPVEVIGRIRDHPDRRDRLPSALEVVPDGRSIRVRTDVGYRDFALDGVSASEHEDLEAFYKKFVGSRIEGVRLGAKCTVMMYGPTSSGKSHTMFGCAKQPGIVYRALKDILGDRNGEEDNGGVDDGGFGHALFIQVAVLEIYNEEVYDLLSGNLNGGGASAGPPPPKGSTPKVRLEVMGKKAKNATHISGNEAGKLSRELVKVEKRRIVRSTLSNERSSRSHCLIILDVPSVGGRLMLVDMAGSENIEQAGQIGLEAKMQTAKINQGNVALKRVVECIANGDSHVPFRDSKLTMLLQDSFEDDKSKILMILCASPDPKEMHKTISTLEYGAKAKCIVRAVHMPTPNNKVNTEESSILLRSRIVAMNQFIYKLQQDNKLKEKECDGANKELLRKEEEVAQLRVKLQQIEGRGTATREEEINSKVDERTQKLGFELMKMEEKLLRQQQELDMLRQRLEEMEYQNSKAPDNALQDIVGGRFIKQLSEMCAGDQGMEKSMELDMGEQPAIHDVKEIKEGLHHPESYCDGLLFNPHFISMEDRSGNYMARFPDKVCLSTVFEADCEEDRENTEEEEVDKEVVEEIARHVSGRIDDLGSVVVSDDLGPGDYGRDNIDKLEGVDGFMENSKDAASTRKTRIKNIFRLCGNHRELAQQIRVPTPTKVMPKDGNIQFTPTALGEELGAREDLQVEIPQLLSRPLDSYKDFKVAESPDSVFLAPLSASLHLTEEMKSGRSEESKKNSRLGGEADGLMEVYVKWEASKEISGNMIKVLKVVKNSTLSEVRKLIETHLDEDGNKQSFSFLLLGDPLGAPVAKEKEATVPVTKLPICNNQKNGHLACLRPVKKSLERPFIPFNSLENTLPVEGFSPKVGQKEMSYLSGLRVQTELY